MTPLLKLNTAATPLQHEVTDRSSRSPTQLLQPEVASCDRSQVRGAMPLCAASGNRHQ